MYKLYTCQTEDAPVVGVENAVARDTLRSRWVALFMDRIQKLLWCWNCGRNKHAISNSAISWDRRSQTMFSYLPPHLFHHLIILFSYKSHFTLGLANDLESSYYIKKIGGGTGRRIDSFHLMLIAMAADKEQLWRQALSHASPTWRWIFAYSLAMFISLFLFLPFFLSSPLARWIQSVITVIMQLTLISLLLIYKFRLLELEIEFIEMAEYCDNVQGSWKLLRYFCS